jgi:hypothetical protein
MLALVLTACGSSTSAQQDSSSGWHSVTGTQTPADAASPSASSTFTDTVDGSPVLCSTVADPGPPSITVRQVISGLQALLPEWGSISAGDPSQYDTALLLTSEMDLDNYHGDQLAEDMGQFAQDEQNYSGYWDNQIVDPSYADALKSDIETLRVDCP